MKQQAQLSKKNKPKSSEHERVNQLKILSLVRKLAEKSSLLFSLRWDINKAVAHECGGVT